MGSLVSHRIKKEGFIGTEIRHNSTCNKSITNFENMIWCQVFGNKVSVLEIRLYFRLLYLPACLFRSCWVSLSSFSHLYLLYLVGWGFAVQGLWRGCQEGQEVNVWRDRSSHIFLATCLVEQRGMVHIVVHLLFHTPSCRQQQSQGCHGAWLGMILVDCFKHLHYTAIVSQMGVCVCTCDDT